MSATVQLQHVGINSPRWDEIFEDFREFYLHNSVQEVVRILERKYKFKPNKGICSTKIRRWQNHQDGHYLPRKYKKHKKVASDAIFEQQEPQIPGISTGPTMTFSSNFLPIEEPNALPTARMHTRGFPLDDPTIPLPSFHGLFGDAVETSYFDNASAANQDSGRPVGIPRKPGGDGISSKWTADLQSASIMESKMPFNNNTGGLLNLESNSTSNTDHGKSTNSKTQRIYLLDDQELEWLKPELGMGDGTEVRALTLARLVHEVLKPYKRDENLATPLSSLLRQIPPSALHYVNEPFWSVRPDEVVNMGDIVSRVIDIKKNIDDQIWLDVWPLDSTLEPSQGLEAYDGALVTWNEDLDWLNCSNYLQPKETNERLSSTFTSKRENMNYSKNICEHISKLMVVREEIWACVISICNSKCTLTTAELIKARSLIEQLETTYQYEPLNQQSCKVIHVVWETLDSQLKECVLQTWGGSIMETSGTTLLDSSSTRLSWNEVDATPPQGHIVTCCHCLMGLCWTDVHFRCVEAGCNHSFCSNCTYEEVPATR